jgi:hypothetical protein
VSANPATAALLISATWAVFSAILVWAFIAYRGRKQELRHGV